MYKTLFLCQVSEKKVSGQGKGEERVSFGLPEVYISHQLMKGRGQNHLKVSQ